MSRSKRMRGNPARAAWEPMTRGILNPRLVETALRAHGWPARDHDKLAAQMEAWGNRLYQCVVRHLPSGIVHLSIKRHDRAAVRDWRHLQQIKNEVVGPEREACELYPAEARLADSSNEYHLWVLPEGKRFPFGYEDSLVLGPEEMEEWNQRLGGKGRQRPWQPGLTTGKGGAP